MALKKIHVFMFYMHTYMHVGWYFIECFAQLDTRHVTCMKLTIHTLHTPRGGQRTALSFKFLGSVVHLSILARVSYLSPCCMNDLILAWSCG